jgi:hypothetical protein
VLGIPLNMWGAVTWCGILLITGAHKAQNALPQHSHDVPVPAVQAIRHTGWVWLLQYACTQTLLQLRPAHNSLLSSSLTLSMAPLRITANQTRMERNYRCSTPAQQHTALNQSTPTCWTCVFR